MEHTLKHKQEGMIKYDWGIWWKAEPVYQLAMRPKALDLTAQSVFEK